MMLCGRVISSQADVETVSLLPEVRQKFDIYHISIDDKDSSYNWNNRKGDVDKEWKELIGEDCYFVCNLNNLGKTISDIVADNCGNNSATKDNEVSW